MLAPDVRVVAMDLLRPPPSFHLDQAVLTTYSLDLETLLALPLAVLAHADQSVDELLADPLLVIEALREAGSRIHVFVDEGGMAIPKKARELYALLEPCVHPVRAPNGGAFHPKLWVARFKNDAGVVRLRVAVLSRNLTFDRCWDVALSSEATPGDRVSSASKGLSKLLAALPGFAVLDVPPAASDVVAEVAAQLARTEFPSPDGFNDPVRFHALGIKATRDIWQPRKNGARVLAIAPFLNRTPLDHIVDTVAGPSTLVGRQDQLDTVAADALERWCEVLVLADAAADEDEDDEGASNRPSGLHAKALAIEHGWDVTWWIGSANLSHAAWKGVNVELMAEVTGRKGRKGGKSGEGIDRFFESGFRSLCQPYRRVDSEEPESKVAARKALRAARLALVTSQLHVTCTATADGWTLDVDGQLVVPDGVVVRVWPVTVEQPLSQPIPLPARWALPLARLTAFVAFTLEVPNSGIEVERVTRKLPVDGMPEGRLNQVLLGLISTPERLLRFLRALLGGLEGLVDLEPGNGDGASGSWGEGMAGDTLLEDLVRAASQDPKRLEPIRKILEDLNATEEGRAILPAGLMDIWNAVNTAVEGVRS